MYECLICRIGLRAHERTTWQGKQWCAYCNSLAAWSFVIRREVECPQCHQMFDPDYPTARKFCSTLCYRLHLNPEYDGPDRYTKPFPKVVLHLTDDDIGAMQPSLWWHQIAVIERAMRR